MDVNGSGVEFYYWINLWYSSLDLIKVYLEDIQDELQKTRHKDFTIHPKLRFKTITKKMREKEESPDEENKNEPKEKLCAEQIELQDVSNNLKDNTIDNKGKQIVKNDEFYFKHNFTPFDEDSVPVFDNPEIERLFNIIEKLDHNTDLNVIIDTISKLKITAKSFTRENLNIILQASELDKFDNEKKMLKDFCVQINFSLQEK
jgi:hypothetical protein